MRRKIISAAAAAAISISAFSGLAVNAAENNGLIFKMDFDAQNTTAAVGRAALTGNIEYEPDGNGGYAAKFSGTGNYLTLTDKQGKPLLSGRDEITITFRKKAEPGTSWWLYASPDDNVQSYGLEHYLGILDNGSNITAERYNNSGARNESPSYMYKSDEWQDVALVVSKNKSRLYIDGALVSTKDYDFTLSDMLGNSPVTYVGRANWGNGEWAKGVIDDIAIYDFAPEFDMDDLANVTKDITLPAASGKYEIAWSSSDESAITAGGRVTVPASGKKPVTLTAEISFDDHTLTREYSAVVKAADYYDYNLHVSAQKGVDIQDGMYGLFFEDINYAADGGLYAEMIENRSFEATKTVGTKIEYDGLYAWSAYPSGNLEIGNSGSLNENNPDYLIFTADGANQGFKNQAYEGVYMEAGKSYNVSVYAKAGTYSGAVSAKVYSGGSLAGEVKLTDSLSGEWTKYEGVLTPSKTVRHADFVIELDGAGTAMFDMVSCIPDDAVSGIFRRDLAEKLKAVNPGFLRFPGGCVIEGYDLSNRYNWKDSIGPVEERKQNWNRWSMHMASGEVDGGYKHYNQTYGMGFYEYFLLSEYLGARALPVVNAGMACQYQTNETVPVDSAEFQQYIQDALDLIEFANGDVSTHYGAIRAEMGHPEPFNLEIMGVGNEQWQTSTNDWYTRYERFEAAIHEKYPDMKLVGTSGSGVQDNEYNAAWSWIRENAEENPDFVYVVDEHYYRTPDWFYENINFYDDYPRDVKVFAGEYASRRVNQPNDPAANTWETALSEAAYLTMVERNADVVYMACYAPLFARLGYTQWSPDMIWFDDAKSYGSPTYYVQSLYSNNSGDYTLKSEISDNTEAVYQTVSYDGASGDIIIKIANPYGHGQRVRFAFDEEFSIADTADVEIITAEKTDVNSIDNPENVAPEHLQIKTDSDYDLPAYSFAVIRVHTDRQAEIKTADGRIVNGVIADVPYGAEYDKNGKLIGAWNYR